MWWLRPTYPTDGSLAVVNGGGLKEDESKTVRSKRSSKTGRGVILVSGLNFGTGSSREQAATSPKSSGIVIVICKTFSEAFKRNLINNGLICIKSEEFVKKLEEQQKRMTDESIRNGGGQQDKADAKRKTISDWEDYNEIGKMSSKGLRETNFDVISWAAYKDPNREFVNLVPLEIEDSPSKVILRLPTMPYGHSFRRRYGDSTRVTIQGQTRSKLPARPKGQVFFARDQLENFRKIKVERVEASRMERMEMKVKTTYNYKATNFTKRASQKMGLAKVDLRLRDESYQEFEKDTGEEESLSIAKSILECLLKLPSDLRKVIVSNLIIARGGAMLPGFTSRLRIKLKKMLADRHFEPINFDRGGIGHIKMKKQPRWEEFVDDRGYLRLSTEDAKF
ncbi:hypothetical protein PPACK8108_LOCUS2293 [Phakopsora pachyrhizi]|uniref:Aconitase A/isopropylmalate dehydratase small subunit swivel domain-containing protein n=1 Tax=Phakopsora pachyrhizi TaxID=170000 RepID=A0AAV0AKK3_PHAPC|nr:hypothetical protein PPACK8108_LOCUS2293 [Phakopsora pachyrhizi]